MYCRRTGGYHPPAQNAPKMYAAPRRIRSAQDDNGWRQCEFAGDRGVFWSMLRGAMWASRPTRCGADSPDAVRIGDNAARVVEDADPYDAAFPVGRDAYIAPGFGRCPGSGRRGRRPLRNSLEKRLRSALFQSVPLRRLTFYRPYDTFSILAEVIT